MRRVERTLLIVVVVLAGLTALGLWLLWPSPRPIADQELPPQYKGAVLSVSNYDCPPRPDEFGPARTAPCQRLVVEVLSGPDTGTTFELDTAEGDYPSFRGGDRVLLGVLDPSAGQGGYYVGDFDRRLPLGLLAAVFVSVVLLVGRGHGFRALVGLGVSLLIVARFVVPAVLAGENPFAVALVGSFAVMIVTLYLCHGFNVKTTAALVGTAAALGVTALLGVVFVAVTRLTGFSSEEASFVRFAVEGVDVRGLVLAGLVIGALGVLDDVTVAQSSTAFAVHDANPEQSWAQVFRRAMNVGRDHIASTINTLVFAYVGASIVLLVLFTSGGVPLIDIVNSEVVAQEVVITLVGSLGLISAVPLTTALAATLAARQRNVQMALASVPVHLRDDVDEEQLSEEERDHRRWVRFLREEADEGESQGLSDPGEGQAQRYVNR
ncbi:MAG: YibE/F family protein [Actinomycetota bacterium]|nr:YibE/F family protein [Actinomycetota bacterium]